VALLFIRDDGAPFVAHVDLAAPERAFVPRLSAAALGELRDVWRRVSQRCWSGERAAITRADLCTELRTAHLPGDVRAWIEEVLVK